MTFSQSEIDIVRSKLQDDKSRKIFDNRISFSRTSDYKYIREIVRDFEEGKTLADKIEFSDKQLVVFGAGAVGRQIGETFREYIDCFIDNKKTGTYIGIPIVSLAEFVKSGSKAIIAVCAKFDYAEILHQLKQHGIDDSRVINVGNEYAKLNHKQYFDLPELINAKIENEVFVDGGGFDGSTTVDFFSQIGRGRAYAYIWEPDKENIKKIRTKLADNYSYEVVEKGMWNESATLSFEGNGTSDARLSEGGNTQISVDSIDEICKLRPTFIKMDIEGSEYQALLGAQKTIVTNKPKLAISVYHKPEDIVDIPKLILTINPDYKLWLRHYSFGDNETVLYAI